MDDDSVSTVLALLAAYETKDLDVIDGLIDADIVAHVRGSNPLAGTYVGKTAVFEFLGRVAGVSESPDDGFAVRSISGDDGLVVALTTGQITRNGRPFVRPILQTNSIRSGKVVEFWYEPLDHEAEDAFWTEALP